MKVIGSRADTIRQAALALGGVPALAAHLGADVSQVLSWATGAATPDEATVTRAIEVIKASETQQLRLQALAKRQAQLR